MGISSIKLVILPNPFELLPFAFHSLHEGSKYFHSWQGG